MVFSRLHTKDLKVYLNDSLDSTIFGPLVSNSIHLAIKKLSIIVPAYNEEKTVALVLQKLVDLQLLYSITKEIIVINDHSTDNTAHEIDRMARSNPETIISYHQEINKGKGAAIRKGIEQSSGDYIVIQDADLELDPSDINRLIEGHYQSNQAVVYGSRFLNDTHQNTKFVWHIIGNGALTKLSNIFTGFHLTDMMTCYKLVPASVFKEFSLKENRFGFEPEITMKLSKIKGLKIHEVPISYLARTKIDGKKISAKDGFRVIYCILKYFLFR